MTTILLALGSNLEDRLYHLTQAHILLTHSVCIRALSPIYETEPWGIAEQTCFLNQTLMAETSLTPEALFAFVKKIEAVMGRDFSVVRNGPRVIDIDILGYGDRSYHSHRLDIPHPRLSERAFVLVPLNDIAPHWTHPRLGLTVSEMLERVDVSGVERYVGKQLSGYPAELNLL
ncbi:MAG: 2-amino-4-hydroxy-6-hydroxymethyldihydropteridine diphosphokinase [Clostridia bacterium]|nr:MAG: 2-amino-4-hydroxy-6-hydroxymethyldihydropteridine diphosphokinase [Clostridia bacterium]